VNVCLLSYTPSPAVRNRTSRAFIKLVDSGEIISQSPEP
jgi:hypothetical protein